MFWHLLIVEGLLYFISAFFKFFKLFWAPGNYSLELFSSNIM